MTKRKVPDRPHWMGRCQSLESHLEAMGFHVTYTKNAAWIEQAKTECLRQPKMSLLRRFWHRVNWLVGT